MFMKTFFFIILATTISACTTTRVASLHAENSKVQIYVSKIPERPYYEIAYIQCDGAIFHTPQHLLNGLVKKADKLNADAIINVKYDFQSIWPVASAVAIKYK